VTYLYLHSPPSPRGKTPHQPRLPRPLPPRFPSSTIRRVANGSFSPSARAGAISPLSLERISTCRNTLGQSCWTVLSFSRLRFHPIRLGLRGRRRWATAAASGERCRTVCARFRIEQQRVTATSPTAATTTTRSQRRQLLGPAYGYRGVTATAHKYFGC
jgi:hypothetical protein